MSSGCTFAHSRFIFFSGKARKSLCLILSVIIVFESVPIPSARATTSSYEEALWENYEVGASCYQSFRTSYQSTAQQMVSESFGLDFGEVKKPVAYDIDESFEEEDTQRLYKTMTQIQANTVMYEKIKFQKLYGIEVPMKSLDPILSNAITAANAQLDFDQRQILARRSQSPSRASLLSKSLPTQTPSMKPMTKRENVQEEVAFVNQNIKSINQMCTTRHQTYVKLMNAYQHKDQQNTFVNPELTSLLNPNSLTTTQILAMEKQRKLDDQTQVQKIMAWIKQPKTQSDHQGEVVGDVSSSPTIEPLSGDIQTQIRRRLNEERSNTDMALTYYQLLNSTSSLSYVTDHETPLHQDLSALECIEGGKTLQLVDPNLIWASVQQQNKNYDQTLTSIVAPKSLPNMKQAIRQSLQGNPVALRYAMLVEPNAHQAKFVCSLITHMDEAKQRTEFITSAATAIPLTGLLRVVGLITQGYLFYQGATAKIHASEIKKKIQEGLLAGQIPAYQATRAIDQIDQAAPSIAGLALQAAGVLLSTAAIAKVEMAKVAWNKSLNLKTGSQALNFEKEFSTLKDYNTGETFTSQQTKPGYSQNATANTKGIKISPPGKTFGNGSTTEGWNPNTDNGGGGVATTQQLSTSTITNTGLKPSPSLQKAIAPQTNTQVNITPQVQQLASPSAHPSFLNSFQNFLVGLSDSTKQEAQLQIEAPKTISTLEMEKKNHDETNSHIKNKHPFVFDPTLPIVGDPFDYNYIPLSPPRVDNRPQRQTNFKSRAEEAMNMILGITMMDSSHKNEICYIAWLAAQNPQSYANISKDIQRAAKQMGCDESVSGFPETIYGFRPPNKYTDEELEDYLSHSNISDKPLWGKVLRKYTYFKKHGVISFDYSEDEKNTLHFILKPENLTRNDKLGSVIRILISSLYDLPILPGISKEFVPLSGPNIDQKETMIAITAQFNDPLGYFARAWIVWRLANKDVPRSSMIQVNGTIHFNTDDLHRPSTIDERRDYSDLMYILEKIFTHLIDSQKIIIYNAYTFKNIPTDVLDNPFFLQNNAMTAIGEKYVTKPVTLSRLLKVLEILSTHDFNNVVNQIEAYASTPIKIDSSILGRLEYKDTIRNPSSFDDMVEYFETAKKAREALSEKGYTFLPKYELNAYYAHIYAAGKLNEDGSVMGAFNYPARVNVEKRWIAINNNNGIPYDQTKILMELGILGSSIPDSVVRSIINPFANAYNKIKEAITHEIEDGMRERGRPFMKYFSKTRGDKVYYFSSINENTDYFKYIENGIDKTLGNFSQIEKDFIEHQVRFVHDIQDGLALVDSNYDENIGLKYSGVPTMRWVSVADLFIIHRKIKWEYSETSLQKAFRDLYDHNIFDLKGEAIKFDWTENGIISKIDRFGLLHVKVTNGDEVVLTDDQLQRTALINYNPSKMYFFFLIGSREKAWLDVKFNYIDGTGIDLRKTMDILYKAHNTGNSKGEEQIKLDAIAQAYMDLQNLGYTLNSADKITRYWLKLMF